MSDYEKQLEIDFNNLHKSIRRQPIDYMEWAEKYANAIGKQGKLRENIKANKAKLKEVDGEIGMAIRSNPEDFGLTKATETAITSLIPTEKDHIEIEEEIYKLGRQLAKMDEEVALFEGAKIAFCHRKSMLELLVQLHLNGYFSAPKMPEEAQKKYAKTDEQLGEEVHKEQGKPEHNTRLMRRKPPEKLNPMVNSEEEETPKQSTTKLMRRKGE